jgi:starch-binding outer membrane protein, SusD/RagB family
MYIEIGDYFYFLNKIKMKNIFFYIKNTLFTLAILSVTSCSLLDQTSPDNAPAEDVLASADGLRAARGGMYSLLCNENYYGGYYPLALDAHSDNGATGGYEVVSLDELGAKALTPANLFVERIWLAIYGVNNAANQILANVDKNQDLDSIEKPNIKGEALFMRALTHFDALKMFGEHANLSSSFGIPIITRPQTVSDLAARATVAVSYQQIITDLLDAEKLVKADTKKSNVYVTPNAVKALLARVYLFMKDKKKAEEYAQKIIDSKVYDLYKTNDFSKLYLERETAESIFELKFDAQNRSAYNALTYKRADAPRPELSFMVAKDVDDFFKKAPNDVRSTLVDFKNNGSGVSPDGRSQKYRGESNQDNPAYLIRYAEILLIAAEAKGYPAGLADLNNVRQKRGLTALTIASANNEASFLDFLLAEHRAEFNMEGHRFVDLVRFGKVKSVLGKDVLDAFPIPLREIAANKGRLVQYTGY